MTGLNKQNIAINFGNGVDTKTDPKLVQAGKLLQLENGVFRKYGRIDKRNGYLLLSNETLTQDTLVGGSGLAIFKDELLQYNKQQVYSFSKGSQKWIDKGPAVSALVRSKQIINNTYQQTQVDSAVNNGVGVYAWLDSRGGIRASLYDEETGTTLLDDVELDGAASRVRCISFGSYLYVFYYKSGSLLVRRASPLNPTVFDAAVTVSTDINTTNPHYDISTVTMVRMFVVLNRQSTPGVQAVFLDQNATVLGGALAPATLTVEPATNCLSISPGALLSYFVAYHNGTNGVRALVSNSGANVLAGPVTVDPITSPSVVNVTGCLIAGGSTVQLFYEVFDAVSYNHYVKKNTVAQNGTVGSPETLLRSVGLWSKAFSYVASGETTGHVYVGVTYQSELQATYFIAREDGLICGKMQQNVGSGLTLIPILQNVSQPVTGLFQYALLNKTRLFSENATLFSQLGVAKTSINFASIETFNTAELGQNLHIAGGVLSMYDGVSVVEHGFHLYPENVAAVPVNVGSGNLTTGTYQVAVCYEWKDNYGNIHRSAPSVAVSVTVGGSPSNLQYTIPTLRLTAKQGLRTDAVIQIYRTEVNGTIFYRTTSMTTPLFNDPSVDTVVYTDSLIDTTLKTRDILYTTGGDLDNAGAPACTFLSVFKSRLFLGGLEDENLTWYSKINTPGNPVEFAAEQTLAVDPQGGGLTALATLDDKQVLFKNDRFHITYGDGPNNAGELGEFAPPQFVTADAGCISSRSIVRVPQGLMFKSSKGIYLLTSSLQVEYVGAEVENFNSLTVISATLKSDVNQVRFVTLDGQALIYDYFFKQWSTFTNHKGMASIIWDEKFVLLRTDGNVYVETPGVFKDADTSYSLRIGTSWLCLDQVTGFQRVYDMQFLGEYHSKHLLRVKIGYDFNPAYQSTIIFDPDESLPVSYYGDDAFYGSVSPYGGDNNAYRWKGSLTYQKCQSVRFLLEDIVTASTEGTQETFSLTSIGFQVGAKGHLGRMKEGLSIGTQEPS